MRLRRPNFPKAYNDLKNNLCIVTYRNRWVKAEEELAAAQKKRETLLLEQDLQNEVFIGDLQEALVERNSKRTLTEAEKEHEFKAQINKIHKMRERHVPPQEYEYQRALEKIRQVCSGFSVDTFIQMYSDHVLPNSDEGYSDQVPIGRQLQSVGGKVTAYQGKYDSALKQVHKAFKNDMIPSTWENYRVSDIFPAEQMGKLIGNRFVADWKRRAGMFNRPVTIYGVLIESLPEKARKVWESKFELLDLKVAEPRQTRYLPITYRKVK